MRLTRSGFIEWVLGWMLSALALIWLVYGLFHDLFISLATLLSLFVLHESVITFFSDIFPDIQNGTVRVGYWMVRKRAIAQLHFLPPRILISVKKEVSPLKAMNELQIFLRSLSDYGIRKLYAATNLMQIERLGFVRIVPCSPLAFLSMLLQHRRATGKWYVRWPWVYVYRSRQ